MRKAASFLIPITLITMYYAFWTGLMMFVLRKFPAIADFFPIGGIGALVDVSNGGFEPIGAPIIFRKFSSTCASTSTMALLMPSSCTDWAIRVLSPVSRCIA